MKFLFSALWVSLVLALSYAQSNSTVDVSENAPSNETLASPQQTMSPFLSSIYKALNSERIFDKIFDVSLPPKDVGLTFYNNSFFYAQELGLKEPGPLSSKIASAAIKAFKNNITPLQFFKVYGNTVESFFDTYGLAEKYDSQKSIDILVRNLKAALKSFKVSGPKVPHRALAIGSVNTSRLFGKLTEDQIKFILATFAKEMQKIH